MPMLWYNARLHYNVAVSEDNNLKIFLVTKYENISSEAVYYHMKASNSEFPRL